MLVLRCANKKIRQGDWGRNKCAIKTLKIDSGRESEVAQCDFSMESQILHGKVGAGFVYCV
jgi:hypothetical protein